MRVAKQLALGLVFLFVSVFSLAGVSAGAETKIGIMNVQRIIVECDAGKQAKIRFDTRMKELQKDFKKDEEKLKSMQAEIKKKSSAWSEEKKAEKVRDFQKAGRELKARTDDARFEMKQLQDKEIEPILKALEKVVKSYGRTNGYTAILDSKNGVVYFDKAIDISDEVIKQLNKAMAGK